MIDNLSLLIAATPRLEVHKHTIIPFVKKLKSLNIDLSVHLNMDVPSFLSNSDYQSTYIEISKIVEKVFYKKNCENPCFSRAFNWLFDSAQENSSDFFFWIEDDWFLNSSSDFLKSLNKADKYDISTYVNPFASGPPFIFKKDVLNKIYELKPSYGNIDPEKIIMKSLYHVPRGQKHDETAEYYESVSDFSHCRFGTREDIKIFHDESLPVIFTDAGREWMRGNKIRKWPSASKLTKSSKTWSK